MERRGRGRGRGRARGKAGASGSVVARVKEDAKRKVQLETEGETKKQRRDEYVSKLELDDTGRISATIPPTKKYPAATSATLLNAFLRDVEHGAQISKSNQTMQSEKPRRLLDHLKVQAAEKGPSFNDMMESIWHVPRMAAQENKIGATRQFFSHVIRAFEKDLMEMERSVGLDLNESDKEKQNKPRRLLQEIEGSVSRNEAPQAIWKTEDCDTHLYTDSEEEVNGRSHRFHPGLQVLRNLRRRLVQDEQRILLMGRSLALVQENAPAEIIAEDRRQIIDQKLHSAQMRSRNEERARLRDWMKAFLYAQRQLSWMPATNDPAKAYTNEVQIRAPKISSVVSLYLTEISRLFPNRLSSAEVARFALEGDLLKLPSPYKWHIPDALVLTQSELLKWRPPSLEVSTIAQSRFFFGNLLQMLGRPMGRSYSHLMFHQDFKFWITSIGTKGLFPLQVVPLVRPPSRQQRALIAKRLDKNLQNREVDESLIKAIGNITTAGAVGQTHTQAAAAVEYEDSELSRSEDEQYAAETASLQIAVTKPEKTDFSLSGFAAENVLVRLGCGIGRLRNSFDVNRQRRMGLELLKVDSADPVPMDYESSEEEDRIYIDIQSQYRKQYRQNRTKLQETGVEEKYSDWPGRSTDKLRERWRLEEAELRQKIAMKSSKKVKKKREDDAAAAFDRNAAIEASLGMKEESWRAFNFKSRLRHVETRMDLRKGSNKPIGFLAKNMTPHGRELQLVGIDEGEVQKRFGLTKLFQKALPHVHAKLAHRRHFAAVFDEESNRVKIVDASPCRLILSQSPAEAHRDAMWHFYWEQVRAGVHQQHILKKTLRYRNFVDNNSIVWKDDLERYQKLREKLNETQAQKEIRFMKLRPGTYAQKRELEEMGLPNYNYAYADAPKYDVDAVTDSDISEVDYVHLQEAKKLDVVKSESEAEEIPPIPINITVLNDEHFQDPVRLTFEETKGEARHAKLNAEEVENYSSVNRVRKHLRVIWNGSEVGLRRKIAARHRALLNSMFYAHNRRYRKHYRRIRQEMAERILYESAWQASAVKRARANPADRQCDLDAD